jgi:hypothetical protein
MIFSFLLASKSASGPCASSPWTAASSLSPGRFSHAHSRCGEKRPSSTAPIHDYAEALRRAGGTAMPDLLRAQYFCRK